VKIVRLLLFSFLFLFLVITGISLLIPFHVRISRATNVLAAPVAVWKQVDNMRIWPNWNPFFSDVPVGKISYIDTISDQLPVMNAAGTSIQWKEIKAGERIAIMSRPGQRPVMNGWKCISHAGSDSTTVQWYLDFHLRWYPWEKFASLLFEQSYGPKLEQGLGNLKKIVETDRISFN
jgi:hypothetical protein